MKKALLVTVAAAGIIALAGCKFGGGSDDSTAKTAAKPAATTSATAPAAATNTAAPAATTSKAPAAGGNAK